METTEKIRSFCVYEGRDKITNQLVYIGTTIQIPTDRFRWHKSNGKDLNFTVLKLCETSDEMIDLEFELIKKFKPKLNKITKRKQNLNQPLTDFIIQERVDNKEWCQCCFKRRVNKGYKFCYYCS